MFWVLCCARACSYKKAGECSVGVRPNLKCEQDDDDDEQGLMPCPEVCFFPTGIRLVGLSTPICFVSTPSMLISRSLGRDTFSKRQINNIVEESYRSVSAWSTTSIPLIQVLEGHALFLGVFVGLWVGRLVFFLHCQFSVDSTLFHFHFCTVVGPARWNKFTGCCSVLKCTGKESYLLLLILLSSQTASVEIVLNL